MISFTYDLSNPFPPAQGGDHVQVMDRLWCRFQRTGDEEPSVQLEFDALQTAITVVGDGQLYLNGTVTANVALRTRYGCPAMLIKVARDGVTSTFFAVAQEEDCGLRVHPTLILSAKDLLQTYTSWTKEAVREAVINDLRARRDVPR